MKLWLLTIFFGIALGNGTLQSPSAHSPDGSYSYSYDAGNHSPRHFRREMRTQYAAEEPTGAWRVVQYQAGASPSIDATQEKDKVLNAAEPSGGVSQHPVALEPQESAPSLTINDQKDTADDDKDSVLASLFPDVPSERRRLQDPDEAEKPAPIPPVYSGPVIKTQTFVPQSPYVYYPQLKRIVALDEAKDVSGAQSPLDVPTRPDLPVYLHGPGFLSYGGQRSEHVISGVKPSSVHSTVIHHPVGYFPGQIPDHALGGVQPGSIHSTVIHTSPAVHQSGTHLPDAELASSGAKLAHQEGSSVSPQSTIIHTYSPVVDTRREDDARKSGVFPPGAVYVPHALPSVLHPQYSHLKYPILAPVSAPHFYSYLPVYSPVKSGYNYDLY